MVVAKLYIEGGGDSRHSSSKEQKIRFRTGWHDFFKTAGVSHRTKIVRGGERKRTFALFAAAVRNNSVDVIPLLLVDSEGPVTDGCSVWQHLKKQDIWVKPRGAKDNQAFLMVQVMETWFLANRKALKVFFGATFRENALKKWPQLENVPKKTVLNALKNATNACPVRYNKGKVAFELLARISPHLVASACPHAKDLLDYLKTL